ncbi:MAG TPA: hypothetical protein ENK56_10195 [Chloroflexi bacterium]|nr:hypothetical protein [Chloroflexota bacterium]
MAGGPEAAAESGIAAAGLDRREGAVSFERVARVFLTAAVALGVLAVYVFVAFGSRTAGGALGILALVALGEGLDSLLRAVQELRGMLEREVRK